MRKISIQLLIISFILLRISFNSFAQKNDESKNMGKPYYTPEEVRSMCGVPVDLDELPILQARQDSMYAEYLKSLEERKLPKTTSIPDWKGLMTAVEVQECGNCWAHAATGVLEGKLHYFYGSNIGIDLDEMDITDSIHCSCCNCNGGWPSHAFDYIESDKVPSEPSSSFPNYHNAHYSVENYYFVTGISAIKSALNSSPVSACFHVYDDFAPFFASNPTGIYHWNHQQSGSPGGHAVLIVDYNDSEQYWLCKNSWGSSWADGGYFRIGYGECCIETWENCKITVDECCFAAFVPDFHSSVTDAIDCAQSSETVLVCSGTYIENITIDKNITIEASGSAYIRGNTKISNTSATLKWLCLEPGSFYGTALGIYNGTGTIHSCYIYKGPYTGWWGIWCSSSTLKLRYGSIYPTSTSSNTSIFLINAGSSSYIRDCWIKPGNGIAISGTADGYAEDCHIVTLYKDSGWDINAYFADAGTFELIDNIYGNNQEIYDPEPYNVSGDGWPPGGLAKINQTENSSKSGNGTLDNLLNQADSLVACGKFDDGINLLMSIISDYPEESAAVFALHKLVSYRNEKDLEKTELSNAVINQNYLSGIIQKYSDDHPLKIKGLEYEINTDVRLGNVDQAIAKAFTFNEKYSDLECGKRVLLGIADIHHYVTHDEEATRKIYALFV